MSTNKLPDKLSALIRMALADLGKVERSKKYKVDMQVWHQPREGVCAVCLAGAVIAKELGANPDEYVVPLEYSKKISNKLFALEYARLGQIAYAMNPSVYDKAVKKRGKPPTFPSYRRNKARFKRGLRKLAAWLEGNGL